MEINGSSRWFCTRSLLVTLLKGEILLSDSRKWQANLIKAAKLIDRPFKLFFDNVSYNPKNIKVHKSWRQFVPRLLYEYGLTQSLLTEDDTQNVLTHLKIIEPICFGVAMIHHDKFKISKLDKTYGNKSERYFSDLKKGFTWINSLEQA